MKILIDANLLIYLNARMPEYEARLIDNFWLDLLLNHTLYTNLLVLDEVVYISKKKYNVSFNGTIEFIDRAILP